MDNNKTSTIEKLFESFKNNPGSKEILNSIFTNEDDSSINEQLEEINRKIDNEIKSTMKKENISSVTDYINNKQTFNLSNKYKFVNEVIQATKKLIEEEKNNQGENFNIKNSIYDIIKLAQIKTSKKLASEYYDLQSGKYKEDEIHSIKNMKNISNETKKKIITYLETKNAADAKETNKYNINQNTITNKI